MDLLTTHFTEVKIGLLTLYVATVDGHLVFHADHLIKQLKLRCELHKLNVDPSLAVDNAGQSHVVVFEEELYEMVLCSEAKVARQFQNWVLHCVLPAVLLDRFYFVGEERGSTSSNQVLEPMAPFDGMPRAHLFWMTRQVLPTVREEAEFYTDHEVQRSTLSETPSKQFKSECMWGPNGRGKQTRLRQQASRKRFARIAAQFKRMRAVEAMPTMIFAEDLEFELAD